MGASLGRAAAGVNVAPAARSARTNDVEARKAGRTVGWRGSRSSDWLVAVLPGADERFAVAAAEQEDVAFEVVSELVGAVSGVADKFVQRRSESAGAAD